MQIVQSGLAVVRRRWWVVLSVFLTTVLIAGVGALLFPPRYEATATLRIKTQEAGSATGTYIDESYTERLTNTLAKIAESPEFAEALRAKFGLQASPSINADIIVRTELMQVSVRGTTPELARDIANAAANQLIEESKLQSTSESEKDREILQQSANVSGADLKRARDAYDVLIAQGTKADPAQLSAAEGQWRLQTSIYEKRINQINDLVLLQALRKDYARIQADARLPRSPVQPNPLSIFLTGSVLGLLGGLAAAFVTQRMDNRLYEETRVREIAGTALLGTVPTIPSDEGRVQHMGNDAIHLAKTNVLAARTRAPFRTLMITSAMPGEGKTTVTLGLAMSLARSGFKVVVVDADLRKPTIHTRMELQNDFGLGNFLANAMLGAEPDDRQIAKAVKPTFLNNLSAITSGSVLSHPAELISSSRMQVLIDKLATMFDFVIVDTPPVLVVPDATSLAHRVERVAMVTSRGKSTEQELARMVDQLQGSGITPMGVIFNRVEWPESYYSYGNNQSVIDDSEVTGTATKSTRRASIKMHRNGSGGSQNGE